MAVKVKKTKAKPVEAPKPTQDHSGQGGQFIELGGGVRVPAPRD